MQVVAINIGTQFFSLGDWREFWNAVGGGEVLWAQDNSGAATSAFQVVALGTTIIIDRQGQIRYRDAGATSYEKLREEVGRVL